MSVDWPSTYLSFALIAESVFQLNKNLDQKAKGRILRPKTLQTLDGFGKKLDFR